MLDSDISDILRSKMLKLKRRCFYELQSRNTKRKIQQLW